MASAGHNEAYGDITHVPNQGQGAEYGFPKNQIKGKGGEGTVEVNADVAERFEAAKQTAHERSAGMGPTPLDEKHKSGMENPLDRIRNLAAVTEAQVKSGGTADTRHPDIGFPARPNVD